MEMMIALGERSDSFNSGSGGVGRGPGEAPLTLERDPNDLGTTNLGGVSNTDMSRALPGDIVGETLLDQDPEVTNQGGSTVGGAVRSPGAGGSRVWKERYLPEEQAVLENYFE